MIDRWLVYIIDSVGDHILQASYGTQKQAQEHAASLNRSMPSRNAYVKFRPAEELTPITDIVPARCKECGHLDSEHTPYCPFECENPLCPEYIEPGNQHFEVYAEGENGPIFVGAFNSLDDANQHAEQIEENQGYKTRIVERGKPKQEPQLQGRLTQEQLDILKQIYDIGKPDFKRGLNSKQIKNMSDVALLVNKKYLKYKDKDRQRFWLLTPLGKKTVESEFPFIQEIITGPTPRSTKKYTMWLDEEFTKPYVFRPGGIGAPIHAGTDLYKSALKFQAKLFDQGEIVYIKKEYEG